MINILKLLGTKLIPTRWFFIGGGILAMFLSFYFTYQFITKIQSQMVELEITNNLLKTTLEQQESVIKKIKTDNDEINKLNRDLQEDLQKVEVENDRLNKLFREHDLTKLAKEKPGLIEKRINDATKKTFDDIESTTSN